MSDGIGALRARIKLQRPTRIADEIGGAAVLWSDEGDVWSEIAAAEASSTAAYDGAAAVTALRVTINRRSDVRGGWRAIWGVRTLRIIAVRDDGARRIDLICEEEKP